jgi:hypothetical protein
MRFAPQTTPATGAAPFYAAGRTAVYAVEAGVSCIMRPKPVLKGDGVSCLAGVNRPSPLFLCSLAGKPFINKQPPQRGCSLLREHSYAMPGGDKGVAFA